MEDDDMNVGRGIVNGIGLGILSWAIILLAIFSLTGCITEAEQAMMTSASNNAVSCQNKIMDAKVSIAKFKAEGMKNTPKVTFKDERNALTYLMVQQMGQMNIAMITALTDKGNDIGACDDVIVAMVQAEAQQTAGYQKMGITALNWTAGLIGLGIISDNWGPGAYEGSTSARTQNNYNSRVVSDSGNNNSGTSSISSSGTGLGIGNNSAGTDGVGGFYTRSQMDTIADQGSTNSNSGELNVIPLPEEIPGGAEIQPVE